ncbi:MAG: hypothetical protein KAJ51_12255 [Thermoplasmata archaeon]|nr:hypothetical protein [Thermoplasmata archaeon]
MKIIAIITENFSVYYDLVKALKSRELAFISLTFKDFIPSNVGVVITTTPESRQIEFQNKIHIDLELTDLEQGIQNAINEAMKQLGGFTRFRILTVGIDPGKRPGIAVIGDSELINVFQVQAPEKVMPKLKQILDTYPSDNKRIRIGHGAPTARNRIINSLFELKIPIEIVDETSTTKSVQRKSGGPDLSDIKAAISIAFTPGTIIKSKYEVKPTAGELREIQRVSRLESGGTVTISKQLAEKVAKGELDLKTAIELQLDKTPGKSG